MIEWLLLPLSGAATHTIADNMAWHGRLMVLSWGVCAPLGLLAARYWKIAPLQQFPTELDHKGWWHAHRFFQSACAALTIVAISLLAFAVPSVPTAKLSFAQSSHHVLGYGIGAAAILQIMHALFRGSKGGPTDTTLRGDHYDMTTRRIRFERVHKSLGWCALLCAWGTIVLGLVLSDAPRWMLLALALWWGVLLVFALRWQREGRCIDTYQAIWGPDVRHPGNASDAAPPIGIGVRKIR